MTVIDLQPPHSGLRLVSTNTTSAPTRDRRYRNGAVLYGPARRLYREVLQSALASGRSIDSDALRVVLASKQATTATPIRFFTGGEIWQLMFVSVVAWCRNRQLDVPPGCATALAATVQYLDDTDGFASGSDDIVELFDAIDECTGGWHDTDEPLSNAARRTLRSGRGPKRS